jgi:multidrug efflux system membrane fusion protein
MADPDADLGDPPSVGPRSVLMSAWHKPSSPMHRRRRAAAQLALFCLVAVVAGIGAARLIKSPAQLAAQTAPPPLTRLTVPVRYGPLTASIVARGSVNAGASVTASPTSEVGAARLVVSAVKANVGRPVHPGMIVGEVSGRPLIALPGAVTAYRNLALGDQGTDVAQLQRALAAVGYPCRADSIGTFGKATQQALTDFYQAQGYTPAGGINAAYLPLSEVLYIPKFPARVSQADSALGQVLRGPVVTISYGRLRLRVSVDPADGPLVRPGSPVVLTPDFGGSTIRGAVTAVRRPVLTKSGEVMPLRIRPRRPLPESWARQDIQVTITSARTKGSVLNVPVSAVSTSASGQASVTLVRHGLTTVVPVTAGASADGFVQVTTVSGGRISAGDQVVVGIGQ